MRYPTPEEFRNIVLRDSAEKVVEEWFFSGVPYVFRRSKDTYNELRSFIASVVGVAEDDIVLVGSARLGFSPVHTKFGKMFGEGDDLDIIVVSSTLFDKGWQDLLRWHHFKRWSLSHSQRQQVRQIKDTIFWGHIWPDCLIGASDIALSWTQAFRGLSRIPELSSWQPKGKLYRTWEHAKLYHMWGIEKLVVELRKT